MKKLLSLLWAGAFAVSCPCLRTLEGRGRGTRNTRSVQGVVTNDADAALEGAVVQLKDTKIAADPVLHHEGGTARIISTA